MDEHVDMSEPEDPDLAHLPPGIVQAIEVFCREQNLSPSEALRALIEIGLTVYFDDKNRQYRAKPLWPGKKS
jgi:hypothetical protein